MLTVGTYQEFTIIKGSSRGWHIEAMGDTLFIPKAELPKDSKEGDKVRLFVYNDGNGQILATSSTAYGQVNRFSYLKVKDVTPFGIFLDWGIPKDLFLPSRGIKPVPAVGDSLLVWIMADEKQNNVVASVKIRDFVIKATPEDFQQNEEVDLLISGVTDIGFEVIIENRYKGMLYKNELFKKIHLGEHHRGFVKKVREDGLIDTALQKQGFQQSSQDGISRLLAALKKSNGFLSLNDHSSPEEIKNRLGMSKKLFKKSLGILYKQRKVTMDESGVRLIDSQ